MNKLDYCISLREKGLSTADIKIKMQEKGFDESEIQYYLKKSDEIFLDQLLHNKKSKSKGRLNPNIKILIYGLSLSLLVSAFYGHVTIGLLGLFIIWNLIKFGSSRK